MKNNLIKLAGILCVFLLFSNNSYSQGIQFEHGTWKEVKQKATAENKLIFIDFYTSWCAPCRKMTLNVFPLQTVGDYYNTNFINYKIDAEKGEGIQLAKKYGVASYPTFMFIDADGNLMHRASAYLEENAFIELAKIANDPSKRFAPLENEFNKGNRDKEFVLKYFKALDKAGGSVDPKLGIYLSELSKDELLTEEIYNLIERYGSNVKGKVFEILLDNFYDYAKLVGEDRIVQKITKRYQLSHSHHVGAGFAEKYVNPSVIDYLKTTNYPYKDRLIAKIEINYLYNCQKIEDQAKAILTFIEKYAHDNPKNIIEMMISISFDSINSEIQKALLSWNEKAIKMDANNAVAYFVNARINDAIGDSEQALKSSQVAVDVYNKEKDYDGAIFGLLYKAGIYEKAQDKKNFKITLDKALDLCNMHKDNLRNYDYYFSKITDLIEESEMR